MRYSEIVETYELIEATTKRLEMTDSLVELFRRTPKEVVKKVTYLTQGRLYPDFVEVELGMAEKLAIRAISMAMGASPEEVERGYRESGDLGLTAEVLAGKRRQATLSRGVLTVEKVYDSLDRIARSSGPGSVDLKIKLLAGLLADAEPKEAKYILRAVTGKLRLGIADMTILDALALAYTGDKGNREGIERAYNLRSDLGEVAEALAMGGLAGVQGARVEIGRPIRMMLAQRLATPEEVLEKIEGRAACEWKYDGERIQIHKDGDKVALFSRRLENITHQYPDVQALVAEHVKAPKALVEGECVAVDTDTGDLLPFQELMHRRRKYGIAEAQEKFPISLFLFDALYIGEDLTEMPYTERRERLRASVETSERLRLAEALVTSSPAEVEAFFERAIEAGCEGLILKSLEGPYQAGARGWLWIKLKRSYQSKMAEPIDVVVVGAFAGRGKRSGSYGALLTAVYDKDADTFVTICKVGTGFTDMDLAALPEKFAEYRIAHPHARVRSEFKADVWFIPALVMEIIGDELTLSPTHTCAKGAIRPGAGIAVRFPRFTGRWRGDKGPEDATTVEEVLGMYRAQLKRVAEEGEGV